MLVLLVQTAALRAGVHVLSRRATLAGAGSALLAAVAPANAV